MIDFEKAIKIVRQKFPGFYIKNGFYYDGQYIFSLLSKDFEDYYTNQGFAACVTDSGKLVTFDASIIGKNPEKYKLAKKKAVEIDKVDTNKLNDIFMSQLTGANERGES